MRPGKRNPAQRFGLGIAAIAIGGILVSWKAFENPQSHSNLVAPSAPAALASLEDQGLAIRALPSPVEGFHAWQVSNPEHPESTPQMAITVDGSPGFVLGELFDGEGQPVNAQLLGDAARGEIDYADLTVITQWLPGMQGSPELDPVYLFADPLSAETHALWQIAIRHAKELPEIRVIPTPQPRLDSHKAVLDIFGTRGTLADGGATQIKRMLDYLAGERAVPEGNQKERRLHPLTIEALSTNLNIHHRLRLPASPTILERPRQGDGVTTLSFDDYLYAQVGERITASTATTSTPSEELSHGRAISPAAR